MRTLRAVWRLFRAVLHALNGLLLCALRFPFLDPMQRMGRVSRWSARMLQVLGISLSIEGRLADGPLLVVSNHVSWLDILVINAGRGVRFVSKAEVRRWPLLGWLVACGDTLFIERERKRDAMRVVHQVADALRGGAIVAVFPEGTTSDGTDLLPFHANMLQAAISTATPVQPLALRYRDARHAISEAAPYVGETSLIESLWAVVHGEGLSVELRIAASEASAGQERRVLAERLRQIIGEQLAALDAQYGPPRR